MRAPTTPATERQINYVRSLIARRDTSAVLTMVSFVERRITADTLTHSEVSTAIDALSNLPLKPEPVRRDANATERIRVAAADVPEGYYGIGPKNETKFYKIDKPTRGNWVGHIFVSIQASDAFYPIKNMEARRYVIEEIAKDPRAAAIRYGKEIGRCHKCHRILTDPDSITRGIGPVCAGKRGW